MLKPNQTYSTEVQENFNVVQAPQNPTILSLVDKFLTTGSEMLNSLILTFPKEGIENVLVSLGPFFDVFVFSCCCCEPFQDKHSCKAKGYLSFDINIFMNIL